MNNSVATAGWGLVIYAVMYLAWSGLVIYGLSAGMGSLIARIALLTIVTYIAVRSLRFMTPQDIALAGLMWAFIAAVLDAVFLVPFTGWALYASWSVWAGYVLIVIAPLLSAKLLSRPASVRA